MGRDHALTFGIDACGREFIRRMMRFNAGCQGRLPAQQFGLADAPDFGWLWTWRLNPLQARLYARQSGLRSFSGCRSRRLLNGAKVGFKESVSEAAVVVATESASLWIRFAFVSVQALTHR